MSKARRIVLACYCLCVALAFVWVPWTGDVCYSWLWSRPQPRAIRNDLVADARQRWEAEYHANEIATVGEKWLRAVQQANPEDKDKVRKEAKRALEMAKLKRSEFVLSHRESMSDDEAQLTPIASTSVRNARFVHGSAPASVTIMQQW